MPSSYDPLLRLELQVTGENENTWGDKTNTTIELLGQAVAGHAEIDLTGSGTYTLTSSNAISDESRKAFLTLSGALTGARTVQLPTSSKIYFFNRQTTGNYDITVQMATGAAIVLPINGLSIIASDGTDCWQVSPPTGAVRVSVSSASSVTPALQVVQTGTGPVFLAEDTNADGSPFVINSEGNVVVGSSVGYAMEGFDDPAFQTHRTSYTAGVFNMTWSNTVVGSYSVMAKSRGLAIGTAGAVASGDVLGRQYFAADVGGHIVPSAYIASNVVAAVTVSTAPANLTFATRDLSGGIATRMTITSEGDLQLASAKMAPPSGTAPLCAARAYGKVDSNATLLHGQNVGKVTRASAGYFTVTFSANMSDTNYTVLVWSSNNSGYSFMVGRQESSLAAGFSVQFLGWNGSAFVNADPSTWSFAVFR